MGDNFYFLLLGGIGFLLLGLWMRKKEEIQFKHIEKMIIEKENNLYELYESLDEIMTEMNLMYGEWIGTQSFSPSATKAVKNQELNGQDKLNGQGKLNGGTETEYGLRSDLNRNMKAEYKNPPDLNDKTKTEHKHSPYLNKIIHSEDKQSPSLNDEQFDEKSTHISFENKYNKILGLKDQGFSDEDIAKKLGIGTGELRLILNFYNRQR